MINYSITARAVNPNLFEINQAKTRINQAKAEGKQPDPKDGHSSGYCKESSPTTSPRHSTPR